MVDYTSDRIEKRTSQRRDLLVRAWAQKEEAAWISLLARSKDENLATTEITSTSISMAVDIIPKGTGPSLHHQILVLTSRAWRNQIRDHLVIWGCLAECIVVGLVVGSIFFQMDGSMNGIHSRSSLIYAAGSIQPYLMLMIMIFRLSREIMVYDRERMDRWYGPLPHVISTCLYIAPLNLLYPLGMSMSDRGTQDDSMSMHTHPDWRSNQPCLYSVFSDRIPPDGSSNGFGTALYMVAPYECRHSVRRVRPPSLSCHTYRYDNP